MAKKKKIKIPASQKSFGQAQAFVEQALDSRAINSNIASETMLLFEAVFNAILSQIDDESTEIKIKRISKLGRTEIKIGFPGKRFAMPEGDVSTDPEAKIIEAFSDKMSCSYRGGYNVIRITTRASAMAFIIPNLTAIILAIAIGIPLSFALDAETLKSLIDNWISPLQKLFTNAMLMVGTPMTLFSLLKNSTNSFILSERHSTSRTLFIASLATSIVAIVLAVILGYACARGILAITGTTDSIDIGLANWSLATAVDEIVPSNIIAPFTSMSPVPMIVVALLITYALFSIGSSFDLMKSAIDACYDLFSRILRVVMALFPLACFLFFLETFLTRDDVELIAMLIMVGMVFVCTLFLLATYAVRLKACGIGVRDFVKKLWPLLKENFAIGSVIEAAPYNVRYCARVFGFSRERLEKELPVMAQTNLDGNCFIIMLLAMFSIFITNSEVSWLNVVVVGLIVLFLSCGAPNQPGSILIGMLIVFAYLNIDGGVSMALCFELFCGSLQNIINVISGVVTVTESETRAKTTEQG
ncbi:MAG: cation:dicarboxylase symporter family transporter [Eggerthellaceae bacterium]|nr:cation:dicarboxylase symporter family transporter [Eggerthellaceae bacterium]